MALAAAPVITDRELLDETFDALRHAPRETVMLVLTGLRAQAGRTHGGRDIAVHRMLGDDPDEATFAASMAGNLALAAANRSRLIADSLSRAEVAARLGVSPQAVSGMLARGTLAGLKDGREWRIPAWQLDEESATGVLPGLPVLIDEFPGSVGALSRWVERPHPDLADRTPRTALRRGEVDAVRRLARSV